MQCTVVHRYQKVNLYAMYSYIALTALKKMDSGKSIEGEIL